MKNIVLIISLILTVVFLGCPTDPTAPVDNDKPEIEYEWIIDTLTNPYGYDVIPWAMWGSTSKDVWIAGFNGAGQGEMFHFNGTKWNRETPDLGFNYSLNSIYGFSENDIYSVGFKLIIDSVLHTKPLVLQWNGSVWSIEKVPEGSGLSYIHGRNNSDIWACGSDGTIYRKINNTWIKVPFDNKEYLGKLSLPPDLGPLYTAPNGEVFIMNEFYNYKEFADTAMFYFSKYSNGTWNDIDSSRLVNVNGIPKEYKFGDKAIWGFSGSKIYSIGNWSGAFLFNGLNWSLQLWDDYQYRDMKGISPNNIYIVGDHGTIRHFNGTDWNIIPGFTKTIVEFYSIMPFEDEIFIGAWERGGYVVRGEIIKK